MRASIRVSCEFLAARGTRQMLMGRMAVMCWATKASLGARRAEKGELTILCSDEANGSVERAHRGHERLGRRDW